jgi:hypothetical protein
MANLSSTDAIAIGDAFVIAKASNNDYMSASVADVLEYIQDNITFPATEPNTQRSAPSASGFTVSITDADDDVHLILTPLAGYAAGTIKLPSSINLRDKQIVMVNCTQAITALTIDGNGATAVVGEPTALLADGYFILKYDLGTDTWYRVG